MLKKLRVRRGCTVPSPLTSTSAKKYDDTERLRRPAQWMIATSCRVIKCRLSPERGHHTGYIYRAFPSPPMGVARVKQVLDIKQPLATPPMMFLEVISRSIFCKRILQQDSDGLNSKFLMT